MGRLNLRSQLLIFLSVSLSVPTLITGGIVVLLVKQFYVSAAQREQRAVARRVADRLDSHLQSVQQALAGAASLPPAEGQSLSAKTAVLRKVLKTHPDVRDISLYSREGQGLYRAGRSGDRITWGPEPGRRAGRNEFEQPAQNKQYAGPVFFSARDPAPQMFLSVPAVGGRVLVARLGLDRLWNEIREPAGRDLEVYVVDGEGRLIMHPEAERPPLDEDWSKRPAVAAVLRDVSRRPGVSMDVGTGGDRALAVFYRVPTTDWAVFSGTPRRTVLAPVRRLGLSIGLTAAGLGTMFWLVGFSLVNRILQPLARLEEGLQKIGRGELDHRIDIGANNELRRVADAMNEAAAALHATERTKQDLIHMIVHDLKNPLSATLGSIDYVLNLSKGTLAPDHKKLLSLGAKSGRELLRMIQNLLDVAKMEEGKLVVRAESFSWLEVAARCIDDLEAQILKENKVISIDVGSHLPKARADRDLVHRVLANLLSNALKHTPPKTEISLRVGTDDGKSNFVVSVRDNGAGIPTEFQNLIFEKFGQAEARRQNQRVGSGLGLTFCKLAVEAHGGRIWVESAPGRGSEFFFTIPIEPAPAPSAAPTPRPEPALSTTVQRIYNTPL